MPTTPSCRARLPSRTCSASACPTGASSKEARQRKSRTPSTGSSDRRSLIQRRRASGPVRKWDGDPDPLEESSAPSSPWACPVNPAHHVAGLFCLRPRPSNTLRRSSACGPALQCCPSRAPLPSFFKHCSTLPLNMRILRGGIASSAVTGILASSVSERKGRARLLHLGTGC